MRISIRLILILCQVLIFIEGSNGSPMLLFANRRDICLVNAGDNSNNSTVIINGLDDAAAIDFIFRDQTIFWTDITIMSIQRTSVNESQITIAASHYKPSRQGKNIINSGLHSPEGIACDWLTKKLYWTDSVNNHLEVSNLDGSNRKVLFWQDLDEPRAIALDPIRGYMYWTDWGEQPKIERASMDGNPQSREVLVSQERIFWPNGLTIDYEEKRIYWMDSKLHYIHSMRLDGSDRQAVLENASPYPFAITLFKDHVYWTDWKTRSIHTCNKHTGLDKSEVHKDIYSPMDIHVFHPERQPTGMNPCGSNNGGCSHLCLMSPYKPYYSCACPTGVKLKANNETCEDGPQELLLLVRRPDIRRISLDTPDNTDVVLPLTDIMHAMTVDYDPVEKYFYWSDDERVAISRARLDGTGQEVLISNNIARPDGVAVDWIARNLYWIDNGLKRIEVARLNGSFRRVLITHDLLEPRALALDPVAGYMYWTDWGSTPKIERANLDGTDRISIINDSIGWPNGIALDLKERKIYWGDAKLDRIEMCDMDGKNRKVLAHGDSLPHVFGLTLLGDYVYWTDWQRRRVERIHKETGKERHIIIEHLSDLMGIKAVNVSNVEGTNACQNNNGGCSYLCFNTPNGSVCGCPMGFELLHDRKTCIIPDAFLLFSRGTDIRRISLNTVQNNNMPIPVPGIKEAMSLDFDINDKRIYWTDTELKTISRAFMNGSAIEHVIQFGLDYPEGMAVDWIAKNLYWADMGTERIEMSRLDGTSRKVLIWNNINSPRSIALDPANGFLYWTDWGTSPRIERAALDGTQRTVIHKDVGRANGLTIDYTEGRLYWTNVDDKKIQSSYLDGRDKRALVQETLRHPYSLTQYEDFIYWADWNLKTIERANKTTGENRTTVQNNMEAVLDLLVFHKSRQSGWNRCGENNGGCSHLCVAHPKELQRDNKTFHCTCPTHYKLQSDKKTCKGPNSFLLYSVKNSISRIAMDTNDVPNIILPIKNLKNIKAIAFDPVEGFIYWIDSKSKSIKRVRENGQDYVVVLDNRDKEKGRNSNNNSPSAPYDLAIDPYGRFLYYTDDKANTINVTSLDLLKNVGFVVGGKDQKPRKLAIDPVAGVMFWLNGVNPPKIEKSRMDGTSSTSLFEHDLGEPCSIAVEPKAKKLYWADCLLKKIEVCDYDGSDRKTLRSDHLEEPLGLSVHGDYVYWIDKNHQTIKRMDKLTGENMKNVKTRVPQLSDIDTVTRITQSERLAHPCGLFNGNCSHLCYIENGEGRCSCPEGLILTSDYKTCSHNVNCADESFECFQDSTCISLKWQCDGEEDCGDGSDELECRECAINEFRCENGLCIPRSQRCDGTKNCPFGIDEDSCAPCISGNWECLDRTCISDSLLCNGQDDCRNGEDEADCNHHDQLSVSPEKLKTSITVLIVVAVVLVFIIALVSVGYYCRKKRQHEPRQMDDNSETCEIIMTNESLKKTKNIYTAEPTAPHSLSRGKSGTTCLTMTSGTAPSSSGSPPYDRNHVTGASSSSSTITHCYPHETLNPPPSPVTDRCSHVTNGDMFSFTSQQSPSSTIRSYNNRHSSSNNKPSRRHHHRNPHHHHHNYHHHHHKLKPHQLAPPTTPCSTDVCDDSESYFPLSSSRRKYSPLSDSNYDSDVFYPQPPPTPRSQCLSGEEEHSCPPSPSTERSFFNPYPPPPSPVGNSDC